MFNPKIIGFLTFFLTGLIAEFAICQSFSAISYNIRYDGSRDGENGWDQRKEKLADLILHYRPAVLGIQEGLHHQVAFLDSCLKDYKYIGVGRDDGKQGGEFSAIFYNTEVLQLLEEQTFWLSKTPGQISVGWDAALERVCTFGQFKEKGTGKNIWIFNTHFDHIGVMAREESAKLIASKIREINRDNFPVILMGDFNADPGSKPIANLTMDLDDAKYLAKDPFYGPPGTFNRFDPNAIMDRRIDYIFVKNLHVLSYTHIDDRRSNNLHISDHLPVMARLRLH